MSLVHWLRSAFAARPHARSKATRRLTVESLENRITPSTAGMLDPTFGSGGITSSISGYAYDVLVQPDGKVVTAGFANSDFLVVRYNANGTLDTTFGSGGLVATDFDRGGDNAYAVALQPGTNGKLIVAGVADIKTGKTTVREFALVRYNANGTLDTTFGSKGKVVTNLGTGAAAYAMAVQPDGRIILAGSSANRVGLVRYTANGADPTFGTGGELTTNISVGLTGGISVQADGRIVVASTTPGTASVPSDFWLARFNANGTTDTSFGGGTGNVTTDFAGRADTAAELAIQSDGRIVVTGYTQVPDSGNESIALARYNPDGSLDTSFGAGGTLIAQFPQPSDPTLMNVGEATDVAIQTDGRIVVTGRKFTDTLDGTGVPGSASEIAERFNTDGTVDTGYGPAGTGITEVPLGDGNVARALAIQPDGKAVFAGQTGQGTPRSFALFRLLASAPQVGSFTASPNPVSAGNPVTLTAGGITDGNLGATVTRVAFYADSNGDGVLEPAVDALLGYGTLAYGTWSITFSTTGWSPGSHKLFALATDTYGAVGDPVALDLELN